jgi:hypothetical protein
MSEVHEKLVAAQGMQAASGINARMQQKFWNERDKDERLEALRQEVIGLHHQMSSARRQIEALLNHGHAIDGRVMQAIDCRNEARSELWIPTSLRREDEERRYGQ